MTSSMAVDDVTHETTTAMAMDLNEKKSRLLVPVVVFAGLFLIVGILGNLLVCFICGCRLRQNVTNTFVFSLAAVDLVSCVLCIPVDIAELRMPYSFSFPAFCKLLRTVRSVTTVSSGLILVAIAVERYRRICRPLARHTSVLQARWISLSAVLLGVVFAWPAAILFGNKTVVVVGSQTNFTECSVQDALHDSVYPVVFYSLLLLLFFGTFTILCVLYLLIAVKIWKGRKFRSDANRGRSDSLPTATLFSAKSNSPSEVTDEKYVVEAEQISTLLRRKTFLFPVNPGDTLKRKKRTYSRKRTTFIMFLMTVTFLVSCLPYVVVAICRFVFDDMETSLPDFGVVAFHFSLKSFILSSAINPFIYGFCSLKFKQECRVLLRDIQCVKKDDDVNSSTS
ncbi:neuromedin-U receptor 2-like [Gigantopelta aegis]|uniref:neuromedin-U receptor 2-like n=1 Tax=Gigantopelta aegis TaxID=1735272 RepID=UPI001B88DCC7|nr:neuromedin-U receptor 2-like [Gigantopelta aegis]XP_041361138.1 neuromedin-U receptor 2-like [Gigantopelta aegis]XP_041361140.1 neuromedin-U receptor 2-like [Gigantopelta aegis]